jgi:hypothetical protein
VSLKRHVMIRVGKDMEKLEASYNVGINTKFIRWDTTSWQSLSY